MTRDAENAKRLKREWYLRHRELTLARSKQWAEENPEKRSEILAKNRKAHQESRSIYNRAWFAENPDKRAAYEGKRRASLLQRTPQWLTDEDQWIIEQAYELAKIRTSCFGFDWHVDHVIPLQGKKVSGLHVPANLQVIPGSENCRKNAKFLT